MESLRCCTTYRVVQLCLLSMLGFMSVTIVEGAVIEFQEPTYELDPTWKPVVPFNIEDVTGISSVALDSDYVFVGQRGGYADNVPPIFVLNASTGQYIFGFGNGTIKRMHGLQTSVRCNDKKRGSMRETSSAIEVWATDCTASVVVGYDPITGHVLRTIGGHGTAGKAGGRIEFGAVADVAVTPAGDAMFVSDGDGGKGSVPVLTSVAAHLLFTLYFVVHTSSMLFANFTCWFDSYNILFLCCIPTGIDARVMRLNSPQTSASPWDIDWIAGNNATSPALNLSFASPHSVAYDPETQFVYVADRNHQMVRILHGATGVPLPGNWSLDCLAPQYTGDPSMMDVWSIRIANGLAYIGVSSAAKPQAVDAHIAVVEVLHSAARTMTDACVLKTIVPIGKRYPHEIAIDAARDLIYSCAVDSTDPGVEPGIAALTRYRRVPSH
eukprot:m.862062 g.862062  ORF g.862062 m.862062 type:complete len:439 (+) comp23534_c0_seq31:269-1585(+)